MGALLLILAVAQEFNDDYVKRLGKIDDIEARERAKLASWCAKSGMYIAAEAEARRVIEIDPDDKNAKKILDALTALFDESNAKTVQDYIKKSNDLRDRLRKEIDKLVADADEAGWTAEGDDARKRASAPARPSLGSEAAARSASVKMFERLNEVRKSVGLDPVELDAELSRGAQLHAEYLVINEGKKETKGLDAHHEVEKLPGYTPEGARAGVASDIGFGTPPSEMVDGWNGTFYHRLPLLRANLKKVGVGYIPGGKWRHFSVLDVVSGLEGELPEERSVIVYPPDGATGIPASFHNELPNPVPSGKPTDAGFPITVTFYTGRGGGGATATLTCDGKDVPFWLSTPEKPATDFPQQGTICLIPRAHLRSGTTYTVGVTSDGWEKTWSFTTR